MMLEMATISMRGDVHFNGERMSFLASRILPLLFMMEERDIFDLVRENLLTPIISFLGAIY